MSNLPKYYGWGIFHQVKASVKTKFSMASFKTVEIRYSVISIENLLKICEKSLRYLNIQEEINI